MIIIMRATLHDRAPNTYYGQWPEGEAAVSGLESPAIAHRELVANARFGTFDVPERDFPGNRSPACWKFVCRPKGKICARGEAARLQRRPRRSPLLSDRRVGDEAPLEGLAPACRHQEQTGLRLIHGRQG
jgi:hypothetical protein